VSSSRRDALRTLVLASGAVLLRPTALTAAEPPPRSCDLEVLLGRRRMVRRYTDADVPDATIRRLIATAVRAPSAGHTQPWAFVVVRDADLRRALGRAAYGQMFVASAPVVVVPCMDVPRATARYGDRGERYATIDVAFASLYLLLAVAEEGLGACFVGACDDAEVSRVLRLPAHVRPLAVVPVGHPAERPRPMKLRPPETVVHRESW
jgi:nitroreductase